MKLGALMIVTYVASVALLVVALGVGCWLARLTWQFARHLLGGP